MIAVAIPFVYVLSFGPVNWVLGVLLKHHPDVAYAIGPTVYWFYMPLIWCTWKWPWLNHWIHWYAELI